MWPFRCGEGGQSEVRDPSSCTITIRTIVLVFCPHQLKLTQDLGLRVDWITFSESHSQHFYHHVLKLIATVLDDSAQASKPALKASSSISTYASRCNTRFPVEASATVSAVINFNTVMFLPHVSTWACSFVTLRPQALRQPQRTSYEHQKRPLRFPPSSSRHRNCPCTVFVFLFFSISYILLLLFLSVNWISVQ